MNPLIIAGVAAVAGGLVMLIKGKQQPEVKPEVLQDKGKSVKPAPATPGNSENEGNEATGANSGGGNPDSADLGNNDTPAPGADTTAAAE